MTPGDIEEEAGGSNLVPIMIRLPPQAAEDLDIKRKQEGMYNTRAAACRAAVMKWIYAEDTNLLEEVLKEIQSGNLDDALRDRIKVLLQTGLQ